MADSKVSAIIEVKDNTRFGAESAKRNIKSISKEVDNVNKKTSVLGAGFDNALKTIAPLGIGKAIQDTTSKIIQATKVSADYIETLNVLDVAFDGDTKSIREFTDTISDTLNLDDSTLIRAASTFKTLANSMGYANDTGEQFSKLLSQMTLDISSLYNIDFSKAQSALQYAVEGQGKTLKALTGASVLETTVQTTLDTLGVDAYVENMTDAEKAMARVIAITYQLQNSQGDLARTIESPSNQFRVLGEQISLAGRQIGNIFLPAVAAILPYLNAVVIVINKVLSALASLFGFSESAWDNFESGGTSAFDDLSDSIGGVGSSLGGVGKAAKQADNELKGLRGFDKLNNLTTPKDTGGSGGGGGGGGGGGFNPKLLKAFSDMFGKYNSMLDGVKTKATQIAEAFMQWAKVLTPLLKPMKELSGLAYTGLIYVWENVLKPLGSWVAWQLIPQASKTIAEYLELVYEVGKKLFSIYDVLFKNVVKPFAQVLGKTIINILKDLEWGFNKISKSNFLTWIIAGITAFKQLKTIMKLVAGIKIREIVTPSGKKSVITLGRYLKDLKSVLLDNVSGVKDWKIAFGNFLTLVSPKVTKLTSNMTKTQKATTTLKNAMSGLKTAALGAVAAFAGFEMVAASFQNIRKNGLNAGNALSTLAGVLLTVGGAIVVVNAAVVALNLSLSTTAIGLIGGLIGGFVALVGAMKGLAAESPEVEATTDRINDSYARFNETIKQVRDSLNESNKALTDNYEAKLAEIAGAGDYITSLYNIVDANGKVKSGYEEVAQTLIDDINSAYGSHIELQNGVITNDGITLKTKQDMIGVTEQYIESIKKQTLYEGYQALYKNAIEQQITAKREYESATNSVNNTIQDTIEKLKNEEITADEAQKILDNAKKKQESAEKKYQGVLGETEGIIDGLGKVTDTYAKGSSDDLQKVINDVTKTSTKTDKEVKSSLDKSLKALEKQIGKTEDKHKKAMDKMQKNNKIQMVMDLNTTPAAKKYNKFVKDLKAADTGTMNFKPPSLIPEYAQGGLPPVGQMFIANERGPELVGQIGGQSFVANQNQMLDIIDRKLSSAGGLQNATFVIQVGSEEVARTVLHDLNSMAKSNGKPITIGG